MCFSVWGTFNRYFAIPDNSVFYGQFTVLTSAGIERSDVISFLLSCSSLLNCLVVE